MKKFNFDQSEILKFYWHDLWREKHFFTNGQEAGGSVMVWEGFGWQGKT